MNVEELAKMIHEGNRAVVAKPESMINPLRPGGFVEWSELSEGQKEGRRILARYLLDRLIIRRKATKNEVM